MSELNNGRKFKTRGMQDNIVIFLITLINTPIIILNTKIEREWERAYIKNLNGKKKQNKYYF